MSRFFLELYLDEDVDVLVAALLRARGFTVRATVEVGRRGASDEEQLSYAAAQQLTVVTHNRVDFEELAKQWFAANRPHTGS